MGLKKHDTRYVHAEEGATQKLNLLHYLKNCWDKTRNLTLTIECFGGRYSLNSAEKKVGCVHYLPSLKTNKEYNE